MKLYLLMDYHMWSTVLGYDLANFTNFDLSYFTCVMLAGWFAFYEKDSSRCWSFKHLSWGIGVLGSNCSCICQVVSSCIAARTGWSSNPNQVKSLRASFVFFLNHVFFFLCVWKKTQGANIIYSERIFSRN